MIIKIVRKVYLSGQVMGLYPIMTRRKNSFQLPQIIMATKLDLRGHKIYIAYKCSKFPDPANHKTRPF